MKKVLFLLTLGVFFLLQSCNKHPYPSQCIQGPVVVGISHSLDDLNKDFTLYDLSISYTDSLPISGSYLLIKISSPTGAFPEQTWIDTTDGMPHTISNNLGTVGREFSVPSQYFDITVEVTGYLPERLQSKACKPLVTQSVTFPNGQ